MPDVLLVVLQRQQLAHSRLLRARNNIPGACREGDTLWQYGLILAGAITKYCFSWCFSGWVGWQRLSLEFSAFATPLARTSKTALGKGSTKQFAEGSVCLSVLYPPKPCCAQAPPIASEFHPLASRGREGRGRRDVCRVKHDMAHTLLAWMTKSHCDEFIHPHLDLSNYILGHAVAPRALSVPPRGCAGVCDFTAPRRGHGLGHTQETLSQVRHSPISPPQQRAM